MKAKYKITAFTRLLIFLIFFSPIAYIGAHYINGDDGIEKFKELFRSDNKSTKKSIIE